MALLKRLGSIFIAFCAVFLMSHNTSALEISTPVAVAATGYPQAWSDSGANIYYARTHTGPFYAYSGRIYFYVNNVMGDYQPVTAGQIMDIPIMITSTANNDSVDGFSNVNKVQCTGVDCTLINTNVSSGGGLVITHYYIRFNTSGNLANIIFVGSDGNYWMNVPSANEHISLPYWSLYNPIDFNGGGSSTPSTPTDMSTVNNYIQFISTQLDSYFNIWNMRSSDMSNNLLDIKNKVGYINDINHYISQQLDTLSNNIGGLKLEQEKTNNNFDNAKNEMQDAADNSTASGDQSSEAASQASESLLSAIRNIFGVITSARPTNCKISGKVSNNFDMGELDFCSINPPPVVQVIGSITLILITTPFLIMILTKMINIFRGFTS